MFTGGIKDCARGGKIRLLNIPIISETDEEDFLKAYEVLDDYDEALDKLGNYESINIWGNEDIIENYEFTVEESYDYIVGEYTLEEFRTQFYHAHSTPVQTNVVEIGIVIGETEEVLPYKEECAFTGRYSWDKTDACYMKNVRLSRLNIRIPFLADGIILRGAVINIFNPEFCVFLHLPR